MSQETRSRPGSLDAQYLEFYTRTKNVFACYPEVETLRYFIFRDLLVQQKARSWRDLTSDWTRPIRRRSQHSKPLERADVVVLVEGLREVIVDALVPVYRELQRREIKVQLMGVGGAANLPDSVCYLQSAPCVFTPRWAKESWDALCDIFTELQPRPLARSFYSASANMQGYFEALNRALDITRPKITINASTQLGGGAGLVIASHQRGISTLLLQHGILQPLYVPIIADCMLTWGGSSTETLIRLGVPAEKLKPIGSPRHDSIRPSGDPSVKRGFYRSLSLEEKPTLVFFSNGNDFVRNGPAPQECADWLESAATRYQEQVNIVVRLHPNEDGSLYASCLHVRVTDSSIPLSVMLEGCDWVASLCSTVLYDALLFRKPVWQFYSDSWPELADNWKEGLALRIQSLSQLTKEIDRMLSAAPSDYGNHAMYEQVFANHGRAAREIATFVEQSL